MTIGEFRTLVEKAKAANKPVEIPWQLGEILILQSDVLDFGIGYALKKCDCGVPNLCRQCQGLRRRREAMTKLEIYHKALQNA